MIEPVPLWLLLAAAVATVWLVWRLVRLARARGAAAELLVQAEPDDALLASAAALKRMGARVTRYEAAAGALEARAPGPAAAALVRVQVSAHGERASRLRVESDAGDARALIRRFRSELTSVPGARS